MTDFTASDIEVTGGAVSNFTAVSGGQYTFTVTAQNVPADVSVRIPDGVATDSSGRGTVSISLPLILPAVPKLRAWLPGGKWTKVLEPPLQVDWFPILLGHPLRYQDSLYGWMLPTAVQLPEIL